jgi:hypothetical protein
MARLRQRPSAGGAGADAADGVGALGERHHVGVVFESPIGHERVDVAGQ